GGHGKLQLWGGIECTVNRVRDCYFDQLEYSGHHERASDLDLIATLGVDTIRYPVLWERAEARGQLDWAWSDARMSRLRELGVDPIVGLVHHGSGPAHTSLISGCFADKLAAYAAQVAARYPWVDKYTPVNEPLTTARFSGLYGHWHPHGRDDRTFVRALLTECSAIARSMAAVRAINPHALLVQTEDMGFTRSTDSLRYQADFENERRWLSLDLLAGKVSKQHPLYRYLRHAGASERELGAFELEPCPPDIIGINYYVTSERFLDSRVDLYPEHMLGGNARHAYADVEAVRVCADGLLGPTAILETAHERFRRPLVITEAHLSASPAQQSAWLSYMWDAALQARGRGAEVRAVTVWALLGAFGWDRLVTEGAGNYEPGAFRIVDGVPVQTEFGRFVQAMSSEQRTHVEAGWWTLPSRLVYEPHEARAA
ncbi:MAG TPA: family 1 glycosylhydrolase, partial [Polyangiaceae bacterium]|nr:family 1 glycosylhydrolase [Polyangiaceae bacterium]